MNDATLNQFRLIAARMGIANTGAVEPPAEETAQEAEARLKAEAAADMAQWPQYAGHFDGYRLCVVKRTVKTKMGVAFERHDVAIATPETFQGEARVVAYSRRNKCDTVLKTTDIQWIEGGR